MFYHGISALTHSKGMVIHMNDILASRLKQCRKEKGYTQREVAIYCDITETAYQNYELMTREPKLEILIRLADIYEVSLDYLTGRTDTRSVNQC